MNHDNYLLRYYKNNNLAIEKLTIKKRLFIRILILTICSIIYFLMVAFSNISNFKGEISLIDTLIPLKVIMIITSCIAFLGIVIMVASLILKNNQINIPFKIKRNIFVVLDWFVVLPICVIITFFCFSYLFIITPVSGDSMVPNISNGEHVFVSYNEEIKRGAVVVLEVTPEDNINIKTPSHFIKRVIGEPGDRVQWIDSKLYINGIEYKEEYFEEGYFGGTSTNDFDGIFTYIKNGEIIKTDIIPEGYYFVMGDNRGISKDSRDIGLIPADNIIGVAKYHMNFIIPRGKIK